MRFYRLIVDTEYDSGSHWYASRSEAKAAGRNYDRPHPERDVDYEIEVVDIVQTKLGVLDALNKYASHVDGG